MEGNLQTKIIEMKSLVSDFHFQIYDEPTYVECINDKVGECYGTHHYTCPVFIAIKNYCANTRSQIVVKSYSD